MGALAALKAVPKLVVKTGGKALFAMKQNKPQIMLVSGVVITVGSFIWAICNARKIDSAMATTEDKMDDIQEKLAETNNTENELPEEEKNAIIVSCNKEIRQVKRESAWLIFKLIGIPCIVFLGGIMIIIGGHVVLLRRFGELSTAFATLQQTFEKYRQMNIEEHGEECDRRYRYGIVDEKVLNTTITDDNGKEKKVKCKVPVVDNDKAASMYKFTFSEEFSRRCPKDPVSTISYLKNQEKYWNIWMETKQRPVTLYMVLEDLGIELDPDDPANDYALISGWRPNGEGDNHIDFGIMRACNKPAIDMLENVVFLNFNCDGNLYHSTRYLKDGRRVC